VNKIFSSIYADHYDLIYQDKNYELECDILEKNFDKYGNGKIRSILDLGCGTGNHAIPLASRNYEVAGVDRSEEMLRLAKSKAGSTEVLFFQGDIRTFYMERTFDAVLMMFAVLGYQTTETDLLATLKNARRNLESGGLLIFDIWYGPAVLAIRPSEKMREIRSGGTEISRRSAGTLDLQNQNCKVDFHLRHLENGTLISEIEESHAMHFFFPAELRLLLFASGFELIDLTAFPDVQLPPDESSWNALVIARAQ